MDTAAATADTMTVLRGKIARQLRIAVLTIIVLLSIAVAAVAFLSGTGLVRLPYEMLLLTERVPYVFSLHMVTSALALALLPLAFATRNTPDLHRAVGRALGVFVVAGGLTSLPVALLSTSGPIARAGFFVQGLVWLALFARGWQAIRVRDRRRHAHLMLAMAAVTTGAVWFRLMTGSAIAFGWPFEATYACAAWAGWLIPLALVTLYAPRLVRAAAA